MSGPTQEDKDAAARERRNLQGNNLFENLGEPIQKILVMLEDQRDEEDGKPIDNKTLQLLSHITVKQLAKIFDMLGAGEDPETILAWLKRRARKNRKGKDDAKDELKAKIRTGAERDPIAFFKDIERQNQEKIRENQELQAERDQLRMAKAKERERKRQEQQEAMEAAKEAMEDDGGWWKATDAMADKDKARINNAFEKFAGDNSAFDNSDKDQDGEWWKKDPYRRDWERNKAKGKKWTAVIEAAKEPATEAELAVREEYYKSNDWWKADKYKNDWDATKDAEWWKEEPYIKDWSANKHEGPRWRAADEESGLEGEAAKYPALPEELRRREQWYKANGPRGVVKRWNAATEGDTEKCSVPEKLEREEYYRNGDWWKSDDARLDFKDRGLEASPLNYAHEDDAKDKEWWKAEPYREDFWKNGDDKSPDAPKGKKWTAVTEDGGIDGIGDKKPAPSPIQKLRAKWYKDNFWKANKYKDDWKKNGPQGKQWTAKNEKEAASKEPTAVGKEERARRDEWYQKSADEDWWKHPKYIEDYHQNDVPGQDNAGRKWPAKTQKSADGCKGKEDPCAPEESKKREDWYKQNWWKQPKYTEDFNKHPEAGAAPGSSAWTKSNDKPGKDKEWWKQSPFIEDWQKAMKPKTAADEWWKQPEFVEDFNQNGDKGKKWPAAKESDGIFDKAQDNPCDAGEKAAREKWYKDNWWRAPQYSADWAKNANRGKQWNAADKAAADDPKVGSTEKPCHPDKRREREEFFRPQGDMWRASGENVGWNKEAKKNPCTRDEALKRDQWMRENWWKAPEYLDDWKKNGANAKQWTAGCEPSAKKKEGDKDPAPDDEKQKRNEWYKNQSDGTDWWKEPQFTEDWARNGNEGKMWKADTRPNATKYGGDEHAADPEEKKKREEWYKDNWWKTPQATDDWKKRGKDGDHWSRKEAPAAEANDPETEGDNWWKHPSYVEDWLKTGGMLADGTTPGRQWTAEDPVAAATSQGHKKPAEDSQKAQRDKWYKDNFWKAPSLADDWQKAGPKGKQWTAKDAPTSQAGDDDDPGEGDKNPADPEEQKKREDWYKKRGDKDNWWKRPEFIEDHQDNGENGSKWTAANPTAGALGQGKTLPATGNEKDKRDKWYKDNWWKAPKHQADWKKGGDGWKKGAGTPADQKKRDEWYKANAGTPADEDEKAKRDDWYRKNAGEPSGPQLKKREDWFRKQLPDDAKKRRMDWLKARAPQDKRIMDDELPDALTAVNEGQEPTEEQVEAVRKHIKWNRECQRDDFDDGMNRNPEEEETVGQDEFLQAVADTNFYVAPDKEELEMQAEEERENQEQQDLARQEEEAAFLAMEEEENLKANPEHWQKKARVPGDDEWWKKPEFIENYQAEPDRDAAKSHWAKDPATGKKDEDPAELDAREQWYKDNWWKAPEYSQQWRRQEMGDEGHGDGWKKTEKPAPAEEGAGEDGIPRPEEGMEDADPKTVSDRDRWYRNAQNPERMARGAQDEWWKQPQYIEASQNDDDSCYRADEGSPDMCSDDEKAEREQWYKDNWWKAPKHMDQWKRTAKEDDDGMSRAGADEPATAAWQRSAAPPPEDDDGMARGAEEEAPASAEEVAEREAWYKQAQEIAQTESWGKSAQEAAPESDGWGKKAVIKEDDPPFIGEKFDEEDPGQDAWGKRAAPREEPSLEQFVEQEEQMAREEEEEEEEEPFFGEKFKEGKVVPPPQAAFGGEKFENEDDEPEQEADDLDEAMKDEDPRELDEEEELALEEKEKEAEDEAKKAEEDENEAWEAGDDDSEKESSEKDSSDDEEDNSHKDDSDLEQELEAGLESASDEWEEEPESDGGSAAPRLTRQLLLDSQYWQ